MPTLIPVLFANAAFVYDGDGKRVKSVLQTNYATTSTYFVIGEHPSLNGARSPDLRHSMTEGLKLPAMAKLICWEPLSVKERSGPNHLRLTMLKIPPPLAGRSASRFAGGCIPALTID